MSYFIQYPLITYNDKKSRNLLLRAAILKDVMNKVDVFYNYIIREGYRPDMVAYEEYGSPEFDWVVYMSNDIVDPYYHWPLDSKAFNGYLEAKYGTDIYTLQSQILHYKYVGITDEDPDQVALISWKMSPKTHEVHAVEDPDKLTGWMPVYVYDYEDDLNDSRRSIKLISKSYLDQIDRELAKAFK